MIKKDGPFGSVTITDAQDECWYAHVECPDCAAFRAKLDREKLADAIYRGSKSGKDEPCGYVYRPGLLAMADAIIAYLKEGGCAGHPR